MFQYKNAVTLIIVLSYFLGLSTYPKTKLSINNLHKVGSGVLAVKTYKTLIWRLYIPPKCQAIFK
jgi:hypothetical protein